MMHHQATMKVGTDAVLLGVWADIEADKLILDAGTGSGILALMAAQRNPVATIHAIDVDEKSISEAAENFARSPWSERLVAIQADLRTYMMGQGETYDHILTNPPFFDKHIRTNDPRRNLARHADNLSHDDLLIACQRLLKPDGRLSIVLPWTTGKQLAEAAPAFGLWPAGIQHIIPVSGREPNRMNLQLRKSEGNSLQEHYFVIRDTALDFTPTYYQVLKEFYLGFAE